MLCEHGYGRCTAPDTKCPHWQGTFCELDLLTTNAVMKCHKCIFELCCQEDNPVGCKKYKRDASDGDYYG